MKRRVVVTGIGAITPIGNTVAEFWNALMEGKSGNHFPVIVYLSLICNRQEET